MKTAGATSSSKVMKKPDKKFFPGASGIVKVIIDAHALAMGQTPKKPAPPGPTGTLR